MNAYNLYGLAGVALFYFGHVLTDITWYSFVSAIIGKTKNFINLKMYKIIIFVLAVILISFGCGFIFSALKLLPGNLV
jgi:hypothetical protein